jgi:hypothetical protein
MAKQIINIGQTANDKTGDPLRTAFTKVNENFTEIYDALTGGVNFSQVNADWNASTGVARILNKPTIPADVSDLTDTNQILVQHPANKLQNGAFEVSLSVDGVVTFPDNLTVANSVIGKSSSTTVSEETVGGTISETTEIESQIEIATTGIVIAKRTRVIVNDTVTTSTDEAGSTLTVNNSTASIKHYVEPEGPNNGSYMQVSTSSNGAVLEGVNETLNGTDYGRVIATQNAVTVNTSVEGVAKYWLFDYLGGLTLPTPTSQVFTVTFDSNHYTPTVGKPSLTLTSEPWQLEGQVIYEQNGTASLQLTNIWPTVVNPGYDSGDTFTFSTLVHGLSDYTLTIILNDVVLAGPAGWTANLAVSQLPAYPSSILANGAIKFTADTQSWVFGADGDLTAPGDITAHFFIGQTLQITDAGAVSSTYAGDLPTLHVTGNVGNGLTLAANGGLTSWLFKPDGSITYPGDIKQNYQDATTCAPGVDTVVYTSTAQFQHAIKLFVMVEGFTDGGGTSWDTQACDVIAVKGYNNNIVHVTTYGVTYTGAGAIATFDGQWNALTNRIEITCRPAGAINSVVASVHAIEMTSND